MAEREVTIKITAKNLTTAEFKKVRKGLAGIGSGAGQTNKKVSALQRGFRSFGKAAPGALRIVTAAAAAAGAAVVGLTVAVIKLGERGAAVADVKSAFDSLSLAVGETGEMMLTALQRGVKGTISNFDLMKVANKALGTGLLKTSEDARTLSEGARLLAKRTGGDTVQAFETLVTAMASGRTAQLKQIGLFVDNKQAIEDYARATGKTVSEINDADRATALQVATMAALRTELEGFPPPLSDFGELIERGKVGVKNLVDELAVMISNSPVLLAGMQAAGSAISKAFGGETQDLALGLVNLIERAAITAIEFGQAGITAAQFITRGFAGIKVLVLGVALAFSTVGTKIAQMGATVLEAAASIPGLGGAYKRAAIDARAVADAGAAVNVTLKEQIVDAAIAAAGNDTLGRGLQTLNTIVGESKQRMVNAGLSQAEFNVKVREGTGDLNNIAIAAGGAKANIELMIPSIGLTREALVEMGTDAETWSEIMDVASGEVMTGQELVASTFTSTGVQIGGVASAIQAAFTRMGIATRAEQRKTVEQLTKDFETIKKSGLATDKALEESAKKLAEAKAKLSEETTSFTMTSNQAILSGTTQMLQTLGAKNKTAAIASAVIGTAVAVVQALRSGPPPGSWILAAVNAAMGAIQIAAIKSAPSFRTGTDDLDFEDFGPSSTAVLHGREAVIPQGGAHMLAREIAGEMGRGQRSDGSAELLAEVSEMRNDIKSLPRAIQRAVRDGVLLAG